MRLSLKTGLAFGITSGVITTLSIMVGLNAATTLKTAVIAGILTIAIADAFSDALSIHISQEASKKITHKKVWEATLSTFFTKLLVALTFLIPVLLFSLSVAIKINLAWGFILIITFNYYLAKSKGESSLKMITEHLGIGVAVITITYFVGKIIGIYF